MYYSLYVLKVLKLNFKNITFHLKMLTLMNVTCVFVVCHQDNPKEQD